MIAYDKSENDCLIGTGLQKSYAWRSFAELLNP